ncbi:MAG: protein O-GlcNAc transferase, partial [Pirellulaceae bacterium]
PKFPQAYTNLGNVLRDNGQLQAALDSHKTAIDLAPNLSVSYTNLGIVLSDLGYLDEAVRLHCKTLELNPNDHIAACRLGLVLHRKNQLPMAKAQFQRALDANSRCSDALVGLAAVLATEGNWQASLNVFDRAIASSPRDPVLALRRALTFPKIIESNQQIDRARELTNLRLDELLSQESDETMGGGELNFTAFELAYQGRNDIEIQTKVSRAAIKFVPSLTHVASHIDQPRTTAKIRVGFLSEFFYSHTISKLSVGLFSELDCENFEKHLFIFPKKEDEWRSKAQAAADRVVEVPRNLKCARNTIAESELDVLFYPDIGMGTYSYRLAYSRLARVQLVSWGHPVTTGIPTLDYFISSDQIEPADADEHYSEKLVRLKRLPCYYYRKPVPSAPYQWEKHGFDSLQRVYLCPQSQFKLHPEFDVILKGILSQDKNAVIVFIDGLSEWSEKLRRRFQDSIGLELSDRIEFIPPVNQDEFITMVRDAHVVLDPVAFGGGNTSYEAMLVGTPVVTWPGPFMRSRVTHGLYQQMGIDACVAKSASEYIELAVSIATDYRLRRRIRAQLLEANGAIFEDKAAVREFEECLKTTLSEAENDRQKG